MGSRRLRPMTAADLASMPEPCAGCAFWESTLSDLAAPADHTDRRVIKADWAEAVTQRWGYCGVVACAEDEPIGFLTMAPAMYVPRLGAFATTPVGIDAAVVMSVLVLDEYRGKGIGRQLIQSAAWPCSSTSSACCSTMRFRQPCQIALSARLPKLLLKRLPIPDWGLLAVDQEIGRAETRRRSRPGADLGEPRLRRRIGQAGPRPDHGNAMGCAQPGSCRRARPCAARPAFPDGVELFLRDALPSSRSTPAESHKASRRSGRSAAARRTAPAKSRRGRSAFSVIGRNS